MQEIHRANTAQRQHYEIGRKSLVNISPILLYSGSLSKMRDWKDTPHFHAFLEIVYITDGKGTVAIEGDVYPIERGDVIIYNAGVQHYEQGSTDAPLEAKFAAFDGINLENLPKNCILPDNSECVFKAENSGTILTRLFSVMCDEISNKEEFYIEIAENSANTLLMYIFRIINRQRHMVDLKNKDAVLRNVLKYIDQNFLLDIGLGDISAKCFVDKFYLSHRFTERIGMTVGQYIRSKRIDLAKSLLRKTDDPISVVSEKCGFNDISYFVRTFKKDVKETPLQYRRNVARERKPEVCIEKYSKKDKIS